MTTNYRLFFIITVLSFSHLCGESVEQEQRQEFVSNLDTTNPDQSVTLEDIYLDPNAVHVILEPMRRATLRSQITSPIIAVQKKMGDSFKEGDILVKLDDVIYRANLKKALATYKQAELTLQTREQLFEADVGSLVELREAQTQFAAAASDMAVARKQLEATNITAPYPGRVVDVYVHNYELAEALEPMMDIIGDDILLARMIIDSKMLSRISIGTQINVYFPEVDVSVPAEIIRIGAEIDPASSTIRVDAKLENKEFMLTSGMNGMATLPLTPFTEEVNEEAPPPPQEAIEAINEAFEAAHDVAQLDIETPELQVEYELTDAEYLEILSELNIGEGNSQ